MAGALGQEIPGTHGTQGIQGGQDNVTGGTWASARVFAEGVERGRY